MADLVGYDSCGIGSSQSMPQFEHHRLSQKSPAALSSPSSAWICPPHRHGRGNAVQQPAQLASSWCIWRNCGCVDKLIPDHLSVHCASRVHSLVCGLRRSCSQQAAEKIDALALSALPPQSGGRCRRQGGAASQAQQCGGTWSDGAGAPLCHSVTSPPAKRGERGSDLFRGFVAAARPAASSARPQQIPFPPRSRHRVRIRLPARHR